MFVKFLSVTEAKIGRPDQPGQDPKSRPRAADRERSVRPDRMREDLARNCVRALFSSPVGQRKAMKLYSPRVARSARAADSARSSDAILSNGDKAAALRLLDKMVRIYQA